MIRKYSPENVLRLKKCVADISDIASNDCQCTEKCICVFRTRIGFRGGNDHTGDRKTFATVDDGFLPFPGEALATGYIAQGIAGRMGSGSQIIAIMPVDIVFRTGYSGRLYGGDAAHYYRFDGEKIDALTWEERAATDLF